MESSSIHPHILDVKNIVDKIKDMYVNLIELQSHIFMHNKQDIDIQLIKSPDNKRMFNDILI